ncbi:MAG TPA: IclR family transcriptional regulator [bacterium]|nr:IclR family transcriptional regulator [bacterium]
MKKSLVPGLERGIKILELLEKEKEGLTFGDLLEKTGIPKPSLARILNLLESHNFIRNSSDGRYRLGFRLLSLGYSVYTNLDLIREARPFLTELVDLTGETVELAILDGGEILYIDKIESPEPIRLVARIGSRYKTLHCTAVGKVFLAYMGEDFFKDYLARVGLPSFTEKTITDVEVLKAQLDEIRSRGYAFDDEEVRSGVRRIASPVFGSFKGLVAVIGIAGPTFRITVERKEELGEIVKRVAMGLSERFGYKE